MKPDRLIGVLFVLMQKQTAPYLEDKFGVSRRTINRDIETLCQDGIPILTKQEAQGGFLFWKTINLIARCFSIMR